MNRSPTQNTNFQNLNSLLATVSWTFHKDYTLLSLVTYLFQRVFKITFKGMIVNMTHDIFALICKPLFLSHVSSSISYILMVYCIFFDMVKL